MREQHGHDEAETSKQAPQARPVETEAAGSQPAGLSSSAAHILHLQRTLGNAAVARMLGDEPEEVQRSAVHRVLRSPGRPLDEPVRTGMAARLGADFSDVRVHTGSTAQRSASEIGARAYTSGNHIVIGEGGTDNHILAHELTHVIQQRSGPVAGTDNGSGLKTSDPSDRFEREAEQNAKRVMASSHRTPVSGKAASQPLQGSLQRARSSPGPRDRQMTNEEWFGVDENGEEDKGKKRQTHASLIYTDEFGREVDLLSATNVSASQEEDAMHAEDLLIGGLRANLDRFSSAKNRPNQIVFSVTKSPCTSEVRDGLPATGKGCTEAILNLATNGLSAGGRAYKFKIDLIVRGIYHGKVQGGKKASEKALDVLEAHPGITVSRDLSKKDIDALNADS
ncbi:DUF4157 domain-containing protein [Saccharopolyspora gloriosae]|uniref:eCIS core domain-containing protein n=1 Tax=Saccharopolyspora gloriosae TaxID=455344 RepID=UPI001FB646ED|nr:DUF4157 domain-containing protein [Saccharopolyspora gloriosae]